MWLSRFDPTRSGYASDHLVMLELVYRAAELTEVMVLLLMWTLVLRSVPVTGLLPWRQLLVLAGGTGLVVVLGEAVADAVVWPVVSGTSVLLVLALGWLLRFPGIRTPGLLLTRRRHGVDSS